MRAETFHWAKEQVQAYITKQLKKAVKPEKS